MLTFEVYDGVNWVDKTGKLVSLRRSISSRELEKLEGEVLETLSVGQKIRLKKDTTIIFEGIIYEIRKDQKGGDVFRCGFTAHSELILYDRHVVYKVYDTGTKAGTIIKDLASLESGVDVSNVDEDGTPQLNSPWTIENESALKVMQSVARGTNYWLRMKPVKALYFTSKDRKCLSFDGVDDYVNVPDSSSLKPSSITVLVEVNADFEYDNPFFIDKCNWVGSVLKGFWLGELNNKLWLAIGDGTSYKYYITGNTTLVSGRTYLLGFSYDSLSNQIKLYVNGVVDKTDTQSYAPSTYPLKLGGPYSSRWLKGVISKVLIYNRVLNDDEVKTIYYGGHISSGLVLYYNFSEGSGSTLRDKSGNNNHGVIYGATWVNYVKDTIDSSKIISAEYSEDRWKLKNRVIYVGANGQILADVSEGAGDLPVVVHDPFLTDMNEAQRRANIRLALNREYGKQLRVEMHQDDFEAMNVDLGDTIRVNLPSLGLEGVDMYLVEIEYDPREMRYTLTLGGRLELFEEFFEETVGGDVAARFGQAMTVPEITSTLTMSSQQTLKYVGDVRYPIYLNKPPLSIYNAQNIVLDSNGYAVLASGTTQGEFEVSVLPESRKFTAFVKCEWMAEKNDGLVSANILNVNNETVENVYDACDTQWVYVPRWPKGFGELTYRKASSFGTLNASVSDVAFGLLNRYCLKLTPSTLGQNGEIYYPSTKNLNIPLSKFKYLRLFLYGDYTSNFSIKVRLCQDNNNYLEGIINVKAGEWVKYESVISTFTKIGEPTILNWISIISPYVLLIDSDYVLLPFLRETLKLKFTLRRDSPSMNSPKVKLVKIIWREGDYQA